MTRLSTLRAQLASLRRARMTVRQAAAWSAVAIAVLWTLAILFVLDVKFEFGRIERAILLAAAIGLVIWAARRFAWPYLGVRETDEDMALLVERRQQIDSDLIAALQFESPQASRWGSPQLEGAVIDYVAQVGRGINVFDGFSASDLWRRGGLLAASAVVALATLAIYPGHVAAFARRLLLGNAHYPTDTRIEQIVVNQREVLDRSRHGTRPLDARCAQGRPISFLVQCRGDLPEKGGALLRAAGSRARTEIALARLSLEQRKLRLTQAAQKLKIAAADDSIDISQPWRDELTTLVSCDAPEVAAAIAAAQQRSELSAAAEKLAPILANWPADAETRGIYAGVLDRLVDGVQYKLSLGDAWTDPARVTMIPLPIVQRSLTPTPPTYAKTSENSQPVTTPQMAVLEGTRIDVAIECVNDKPLTSAWMNVRQGNQSRRLELRKADETGLRWQLDVVRSFRADQVQDSRERDGPEGPPYNPLSRVTKELTYEIQVLDADGLSLETPLRGTIRIKPDRAPSGGAEIVHKVVLPDAQPVIEYRATDDFGVARVRLAVDIERRQGEIVPTMPPGESASHTGPMVDSSGSQMESATLELYSADGSGQSLQTKLTGQYALDLARLPLAEKLAKGDRVKLTLEVVDFRGVAEGRSYYSDPFVLEISDESGVLAAISEADERSEQRLTDIIKRQLGIGESP